MEDRLAMLELAVADFPKFCVSDIEAKKERLSYTVDTLEELSNIYSRSELFFLMGEDSLINFCTWHRWKRLLELADLVVMKRRSKLSSLQDMNPELHRHLTILNSNNEKESYSVHILQTELHQDSSTEIRQQMSKLQVRGKLPTSQLPPEVLNYIQLHQIYQ